MKKTINQKTAYVATSVSWFDRKIVEGYPVTIGAWRPYKFFAYEHDGWWEVCEVSTGMCIGPMSPTHRKAMRDAINKAQVKDLNELNKSIASHIECYGPIPAIWKKKLAAWRKMRRQMPKGTK